MHYKVQKPLKIQRNLELWEVRKDEKIKQVIASEIDRDAKDRYQLREQFLYNYHKEFDPGSGRTLAARLTHASRTEILASVNILVADGWVTREQPASKNGIASGNGW